MGANTFIDEGIGKDAQDAFNKACEQAAWEYGHGGYTGTIAEKHSFILIPRPEGTRLPTSKLLDFVNSAYPVWDGNAPIRGQGYVEVNIDGERYAIWNKVPVKLRAWACRVARSVNDKWGPAGAMEMTASELRQVRERRPNLKGKRVKGFVFFGWASS